ncbi:hypothetical protein LK533_07715 [Sphingomonas sp. PL-96]|uniref:DUF3108 domain-containing protein n=1 Tax=Sphingomonas sp. PL-96 TaxID=2887201 RepID=UPI001E544978|nr:hypothetical protein [Sphingomonas sp. PL-96]MCC2976560.1 hypothetical protein [Sphingomonas sp. PL-96]
MKTLVMVAALATTGAATPKMEGGRLQAGSTCYAIVAGDRTIGSTLQTITASRDGGKPAWDIVVHQKLENGAFDMRDHFIVDRETLLPIRMDSQRGRGRNEKGWHRVSVEYGAHGLRGTKETATGSTPLDVALARPTWDGNLWGLTFAALPLKEGGTYAVPFWQYDKGFGAFTARVVGSEDLDTPSGKIAAWIVEAGDDPAQLARYKIAKTTRQELGYAAGPSAQRLGGVCQ